MSGKRFDLDAVQVNPDIEDKGNVLWFGGGPGVGVPIIVRHFMYLPYQRYKSELEERNAFLLRGNSNETIQMRDRLRSEAMAKEMIVAWGDGIQFNGETLHGADLYIAGEPILWEVGSNGGTSREAQKRLVNVLVERKYRPLKETILAFAMDDSNFNRYEESESAENLKSGPEV